MGLRWDRMGLHVALELTCSRFVREDISDLLTRLKKEEASLKDDIESLKKKQTYLETTFTNATSNLQAILQGGRA
jgi:chaperonin cofactor prefoldin